MDQFDMYIFLGLPDTQFQYSFFQQAKFKRALLYRFRLMLMTGGIKYEPIRKDVLVPLVKL